MDSTEVEDSGHMALTWDPWRELNAIERQFSQFFDRDRTPRTAMRAWAPPLDAFHRDNELVVRTELPGVKPEDIDVHVEDRMLVVRGERKQEERIEEGKLVRNERVYGTFERTVLLPEGTDAGSVEASYDHGVLEVRVPHPKQLEPQKVQVQVGAADPQAQAVEASSSEVKAGDSTASGDHASSAAA